MQSSIEKQYHRDHLFETIVQALTQAGIDKDKVTRKDLAMVDEFHVRAEEATRELASQTGLRPGMQVLDLGCGIGGAARLLADEFDCTVTGIDIIPEYIRTAQELSLLTHLQHRTHFVEGSALDLPFDKAQFDVVWTQHVQMNIADKKQLYAEVTRVLKPGGRFVYYDVLAKNNQPLHFPVPWAADVSMNWLVTSDELHALLQQAGLQPLTITDQSQQGIQFLQKVLQHIEVKGMPNLGIQLLMGANAPEKLHNLYTNLVEERIVLQSGICELLTIK